MDTSQARSKAEGMGIDLQVKKSICGSLAACTGETSSVVFPAQASSRMGGRVVDRARLESVFTFIGNEGSNPSPSAS